MRTRGGFTLLELLIFMGLFAGLSIATLHVLVDGRLLRAKSRDRQQLALLAQSELDRVRTLDLKEIRKIQSRRTNPEWPAGTEVEVFTEDGPVSGTTQLGVTVRRDGLDGLAPVRLVTLIATANAGSAL